MNILAPSILSADFNRLGEEIENAVKGGADWIHFDVMDGVFVPSISFGFPVLKCVRDCTVLPIDVHLMITEPERYIEEFADTGADGITVHLETLKYPEDTLRKLRDLQVKVGLAINPETSIHAVEPFLNLVDMVLIMTVRPGFGGQKFIDYCLDKVEKLAAIRRERGLDFHIEVDGGICKENLKRILGAGANVIVMGSAVFGGDTYENTRELKSMMEE